MIPLLKDIVQLSPLWSLSLTAFIPLTAKALNKNRELKPGLVCGIGALAILSSLFLFLFVGFKGGEALSLRFDSYSSGACALTALASLASLSLFHFNSWIDKKQLSEIVFVFCQGVLGLYVFCLSQDLLSAFVGLETASIAIYINLAMSRKDSFCLEAGIKYFVLSALSSAVFLYGLSFLFGAGGSLELEKIFQAENQAALYSRFFFLGLALVFAGLFFKTALFPFQSWLADVYQGALTPMTAFMATAMKSALILFLGKIFAFPIFEKEGRGFIFLSGLALASVLTAMFGNIMALRQTRLKRLAGFSSLAHSGYLMMALYGILSLRQDAKDFAPVFFYLLAYIFLTSGLLLGIQALEKKSSQPELKDLKGMFSLSPFWALGFSIFLLGLAGIPPLFGFFAKIGLFQPLILSSSWQLLFWAFAGSAIGLYYYIKPVTLMLGKGESPAALSWPLPAKAVFLFLSLAGVLGPFAFGVFFY